MFKYENWEQAIPCNEWFKAITTDIKNKYKIDNPKFCIDDIFLEEDEFEKWKKEFMKPPFLWIQYKHIENNIFELKPHSPWPSNEVSMNIINAFLEGLVKEKQAKHFCINKYYEVCKPFIDEPGETIYTLSEAKIELRSLFRRGFSKIKLVKETIIDTGKKKEKVYHLHVSQDSIENMLKSGYLKLEYSNEDLVI